MFNESAAKCLFFSININYVIFSCIYEGRNIKIHKNG